MKEEQWRVAVLVDEAHNLLERARAMYSASLEHGKLDAALKLAPPSVRPALASVGREWRRAMQAQRGDYEALREFPVGLARVLREATSALAEHTAKVPDESGPLQDCFFQLLALARLADSFGAHSVFESTVDPAGRPRAITIRNLVPAPFLQPRFLASMTTVCFSGTLAPFDYYRDLLGLPADTVELDVPSPFEPQQLRVAVTVDLSTRLRDRHRSLPRLVDLMAAQFVEAPGNYLAFFSSFEYLEAAHATFASRHPGIPVWAQSAAMREDQREAFVDRFQVGGRGIAFAVLGGAFAEGIDLPGDRLIGAFIASLGLPQHDEANEVVRDCMQGLFGRGYDYTYLFPGLRKVVQAAGRVIRTHEDTGVVYLLDDRFGSQKIFDLLPSWWQVDLIRSDRLPFSGRALSSRG